MDCVKDLFEDTSGVSPVIGVILMVAVTVIIAAVIGSTVLGLGNSVSETPPQSQLSISQEENVEVEDGAGDVVEYLAVDIEHTGGDDIDPDNIKVTVDGTPAYSKAPADVADPGYDDHPGVAPAFWDQDTISAGDTTRLFVGNDLAQILDDENLVVTPLDEDRVLYHPNDGPPLWGREGGEDDGVQIGGAGEDIMLEPGQTIRVVWEAGDESQELAEYEIED